MVYSPTIVSILEVLLVTIPVLLTVAFVTVAERKTMASMQRRLGPNIVGYYGLLQAFADALKLLLKEYISPTQANLVLFFLGPIITLIFSLLGYAVVPYGPGLAIWDFNLGILYMLAVSSLATYGILLAGWSANSKYAFLGSLRSTAQLISYELILSSAILLVILLTGSLNLTVNIEAQRTVWFLLPLLPVFIIFFIGSVAETNRPPFDLAEAESELVSGFMTEHAAVIFVFFFLAEYASIVLICILNAILFIGGYLTDYTFILSSMNHAFHGLDFMFYTGITDMVLGMENFVSDIFYLPLIEGTLFGLILGIKSCLMIFIFIWVRASFPRIRFDQLMSFSWTILLPVVIGFIVLIPCLIYGFEMISGNVCLFGLLPVTGRNYIRNIIYSAHKNLPIIVVNLLILTPARAAFSWALIGGSCIFTAKLFSVFIAILLYLFNYIGTHHSTPTIKQVGRFVIVISLSSTVLFMLSNSNSLYVALLSDFVSVIIIRIHSNAQSLGFVFIMGRGGPFGGWSDPQGPGGPNGPPGPQGHNYFVPYQEDKKKLREEAQELNDIKQDTSIQSNINKLYLDRNELAYLFGRYHRFCRDGTYTDRYYQVIGKIIFHKCSLWERLENLKRLDAPLGGDVLRETHNTLNKAIRIPYHRNDYDWSMIRLPDGLGEQHVLSVRRREGS